MLRRPDVAVDDAVPVGVRQPAAHALDDLDFLGPGQRPLGVVAEQRFEASAFLDVLDRLDEGVVVPREHVAGLQQIRVRAQEARGVLAVEDLAQAVLLLLRRGVDVEVIDLQIGQGLGLDEAVFGQEHGEAIILVQFFDDVVQPDLPGPLRGARGEEGLADRVVGPRDVPGADGQPSGLAQALDHFVQVDHPSRLIVVELDARLVVGQQDQRLDEDLVQPTRVLPEFAGQHLGFLVGQRDRAGVNAAVLKDPLQRVAPDRAAIPFHLQVVQGVRAEDRDVVFVGEPASGRHFKVMKHEVVIGQFLAEPLDRFGFAVILRDTDAMNNCHG